MKHLNKEDMPSRPQGNTGAFFCLRYNAGTNLSVVEGLLRSLLGHFNLATNVIKKLVPKQSSVLNVVLHRIQFQI